MPSSNSATVFEHFDKKSDKKSISRDDFCEKQKLKRSEKNKGKMSLVKKITKQAFVQILIRENSKTTLRKVKILPIIDSLASNYITEKFPSRNPKL